MGLFQEDGALFIIFSLEEEFGSMNQWYKLFSTGFLFYFFNLKI
jgi:hypothetical protein